MTSGTPAIAFTRTGGWPACPHGTDGFRLAGGAAAKNLSTRGDPISGYEARRRCDPNV